TESQLTHPIKIFNQYHDINLSNISPIYQTAPLPYTHQPNFLNFSLQIQTTLTLLQLFQSSFNTQQSLHPITNQPSPPTTLH
ncbi:2-amino-4-hydroxy-6-hydroxymethyldihydropteridine diphosphokinase, partial [Staphylococcus aureus]|uniref:2-amino-4-hydroxy-6- hydroxymethyldihydropteridine diphosphokinase n=1 Tax=Staphylococcus aureus TaxID=1280 RepID=UPI001642F9E3